MGRFKAVLIIVGAGLLLGAIAFRFWPTEAAEHWVTAEARKGDIEDLVTASGTLQPRDYVDVGTQVSGQLMKLHVDVGDTVETGDLLAEIDPSIYLSRVEASRAQLRNQRAQLLERRAQLTLAQQQYERQQNLMREKATTTEALESAEASLRSIEAQIEALAAQIEQTESTLRGDEANLGYTKIYAPMSGTVVSLSARQGQTLNANQQAPIVLRIADLAVMTVQAQVSEADVSKLRLGMDVYFTTLGNRNERFYGKLRQIMPTPEVLNNVVLYNALFDVPNPERKLMTQMTAQVFFVVAAADNAVLVPSGAVQRRTGGAIPAVPGSGAGRPDAGAGQGSGAFVRVINARGEIEERAVVTGVSNRVSVQIVSGLEAGERVIIGERRSAGEAQRSGPSMPPRL
jgi:macrolide-specific efflux system membrane fusion protein